MTTTPEALRDQGMDQATDHSDPRLVLMIDSLIAEHNATGTPWSANDIRDRVPTVGQGLVGARVKAAFMRRPREMRQVGWTRSSLRSTHAKPIAKWQGVR